MSCVGPPRDLHVIVGPSRDQLRCAIPTRFSGGSSHERRVRRVCASDQVPKRCKGPRREGASSQAQEERVGSLYGRSIVASYCICGCVHVLSIGRAFGRGRSAHSPSSPPSGASTHTPSARRTDSPSAHPTPHATLMPPSTFTKRVSATQTYIRSPDLHARRYRCGWHTAARACCIRADALTAARVRRRDHARAHACGQQGPQRVSCAAGAPCRHLLPTDGLASAPHWQVAARD